MGRPKKVETMETVSVRVPKAMIVEIDKYVESLKGDMPLLNISRADGVRQLLVLALNSTRKLARKAKKS